MKSILIEAVANGWLVRPFSPCRDWAYGPEAENLFVFTTLAELQAQLPELMRYEELTAREARAREMESATLVEAPTCQQTTAALPTLK
jgi:hypothetical protein